MTLKKSLSAILIFISLGTLEAQEVIDQYYQQGDLQYEDHIYRPGIHTVKLHPVGDDRGMPVIQLNTGDQLELSFDDLYDDYLNLSYTVIHCNADWTPSGLLQQEYISNFQDAYIQDYEYSMNALVPYTNYKLVFPSNNMRITKSGNYILMVYANDDKNDLVLTRRFMVYEGIVSINAQVKRATQVELMNTHQEIDFSIQHSGYNIPNPFSDLKVHLYQDQRMDNVITNLKPQFLQNDELVYQYDRENTFLGGNEYRFFDLKSLKVLSQNVNHIAQDSVYTAFLKPDDPRAISKYAVYFDIDGQYVIRRLDADNSDAEADYAYVDFLLNYPSPIKKGDVYLFGKFTDWKLLPGYRMNYDYKHHAYRARVLLKQGYYNYMYAILNDQQTSADVTEIEGSHWETENTYQILVYNREIGQRYDRLIGYAEFSSDDLY